MEHYQPNSTIVKRLNATQRRATEGGTREFYAVRVAIARVTTVLLALNRLPTQGCLCFPQASARVART